MTLRQFKWVDLLLFSIIAVVFEVINHFATITFGFFQLIFMSFTIVLTLISMYRWGISGMMVIIFASIIAVAITDKNNQFEYYAAYIGGGILGMIPGYIIFQIIIGKKKLKNTLLLIPYLLFDFVLVILFRSLISALFHLDTFASYLADNLKALLVQECMSMVTSTIILLIANRKNGNIMVEMNKYVQEVHDLKKLGNLKEMRESPNFNSDSQFTEFDQIDDSTILDGGTMDVDQLKELSKMYEECDKILDENPMDCLTKKHEVEKK